MCTFPSPIVFDLLIALMLCTSTAFAWPQADRDEQAAQFAQAGQKALSTGHYPEARENFERLAKLDPDIAEVHATLAAIYFKLRQFEFAVREVRMAQKLKPALPKLDSLLALSLSGTGSIRRSPPPP